MCVFSKELFPVQVGRTEYICAFFPYQHQRAFSPAWISLSRYLYTNRQQVKNFTPDRVSLENKPTVNLFHADHYQEFIILSLFFFGVGKNRENGECSDNNKVTERQFRMSVWFKATGVLLSKRKG